MKPWGCLELEFEAAGEACIVVHAVHSAYQNALAMLCEEGASDELRGRVARRIHELAQVLAEVQFNLAVEEAQNRVTESAQSRSKAGRPPAGAFGV